MTPYLSLCMGLGGNVTRDLLDRFIASCANTIQFCEEFNLPAEIVVTLWNYPVHLNTQIPVSEMCPVRNIQTGNLHHRVPNPHGFQYFEWYPKNISLRRARGEFLLCTNPDDLWSVDLAKFLAKRELQHGHFYRVNRYDTREGKVFAVLHPTGPKRLGASEADIRKHELPRCCPWSPDMLHYNAAGDFTLMSRDDWFMIHGNPEREYNDSVDGQTLWLAHQKGLKQVVLPFALYHPDHPRTLNHAFVPGWDDNFPHAKENGEDWGFGSMQFPETTL